MSVKMLYFMSIFKKYLKAGKILVKTGYWRDEIMKLIDRVV